MKRVVVATCASWALAILLASAARAQAVDETARDQGEKSAWSARAGMFLPYTMAPRTDTQRVFALMLGGYDQAKQSPQLEGTAELTIFGPVAARVGVLYGQTRNALRPSAGLRVQALSQASQEIDLSLGAFYRPEGFTEAEGEVEAVLAVGRRFGRLGLFANLIYGQDPEGAERDGEARVAGLYALSARFLVGLDTRMRFDLGSVSGARRAGEAEYDFVTGPLVSYVLGDVALLAQAGVSVLGMPNSGARVGPAALAGLAGSI